MAWSGSQPPHEQQKSVNIKKIIIIDNIKEEQQVSNINDYMGVVFQFCFTWAHFIVDSRVHVYASDMYPNPTHPHNKHTRNRETF